MKLSKIKIVKESGAPATLNDYFVITSYSIHYTKLYDLVDYAKTLGMPGIGYVTLMEDGSLKGPIDKFLSEEERDILVEKANLKTNSVLFFIADKKKAPSLAGAMRSELGRRLELIDKSKFDFCFIVDFPMYEWDEEEDKYIFTHNPSYNFV